MSTPALQQLHKFRLIYRRIIKNHQNWAIDVDHWRCMVSYTRSQFESIQAMKNPVDQDIALRQQEQWIDECAHPDPYVPVQQVGGPVFQRNVPPPYEILDPPEHLNPADPYAPKYH